jgi:arylsulfatase A
MRKTGYFFLLLAFAGCNVQTSPSGEPGHDSRKPNVILVLTDDQGYGDLSVHGNPHLNTPNIDEFAKSGIMFSGFYVAPACSPTRAGLLTGRYNFRTKTLDVGDRSSYMSTDEITIAELLKENGYTTGMFGKWHLGENYPLRPLDQGFDVTLCHHFCNITNDYPVGTNNFDTPLFYNGVMQEFKGYCQDIYTEHVLKFIEEQAAGNQPFFAYFPTTLAHVPLQVPESYAKPFLDMGLPEETAKVYGMIQSIDESFGKILKKLEELGIRDNTMIIYMSDNGQASFHPERYQANLRGLKGFMYESGVRVPCFMQLPGKNVPKEISLPTAYIDVLPTILDVCGIPVPESYTIDGRSLKPLMMENKAEWPERNIYIQWKFGGPEKYRHIMVRNNTYKLIQEDESDHSEQRLQFHYDWCKANGYENYRLSNDIEFELYNIIEDSSERKNIADRHPEIVERLRQEYESWYEDVLSTRGTDRPLLKFNIQKENPVVLTSNFWLNPRSWEMGVETPGTYDIKVVWGNTAEKPEKLFLKVGGQQYETGIDAASGEHVFKNVIVTPGMVGFSSWVNHRKNKGSYTMVIGNNEG